MPAAPRAGYVLEARPATTAGRTVTAVDDNSRDIFIALLGTLGGFLTALAVALVVGGQQRGLENLKWRRELYAAFMGTADRITQATYGQAPMPIPELLAERDRLLRLHFEIVMLRPGIGNVTGELYEQASNVVGAWLGGGVNDLGETVDQAQSRYLDAWSEFREAAVHDLGTQPSLRHRVVSRCRSWRIPDPDYYDETGTSEADFFLNGAHIHLMGRDPTELRKVIEAVVGRLQMDRNGAWPPAPEVERMLRADSRYAALRILVRNGTPPTWDVMELPTPSDSYPRAAGYASRSRRAARAWNGWR
jgi:hypothetical protein